MRNPKWHRDEIILALDLYFSESRGSIDHKNPKIIELSKALNALPLFPNRPDKEKFRNPNGVTLKLSNFLAIDPSYSGKGMTGGSNLDRDVFNQFYERRAELAGIAHEIRATAGKVDIRNKIYAIEDDDQTILDSVNEGQVLYKLHKVRERDPEIVGFKKRRAIDIYQKLECEACTFDFLEFYGPVGEGYIECHHRMPLSLLKVAHRTTLEDLALVCSNCHRMLHKGIDTLSVEQLRAQIRYPPHWFLKGG